MNPAEHAQPDARQTAAKVRSTTEGGVARHSPPTRKDLPDPAEVARLRAAGKTPSAVSAQALLFEG